MPKHILVTSPQSSFCELLRSSLEETGKYEVQAADSGKQALARANERRFDLAILDSDVDDQPVSTLGRSLQEQHPSLLLVVIPPENDPQHLSMINFIPDSYLERPFYLPDLMEKLSFLLEHARPAQAETAAAPEALWPLQSNQTGAILDKLLHKSFLTAALIFSPDGDLVRHNLGLPEAKARRLAGILQPSYLTPQHGQGGRQVELAHYLRLDSGDHLLYAVPLADGVVLAGLMDCSVPVSQARSEVHALRDELLQVSVEKEPAPAEEPEAEEPQEVAAAEAEPSDYDLSEEEEDFLARLELEGPDEDEGEPPAINLSDLLATMPPPDPDRMPISMQEWQHLADDDDANQELPAEPAAEETQKPAAETATTGRTGCRNGSWLRDATERQGPPTRRASG